MQVNDLRVEKYNKISYLSNLSSPSTLSQIKITNHIHYTSGIECFKSLDRNSQPIQIYITKNEPREITEKIVYLKSGPKILLLKGAPQSVVIQENVYQRLDEKIIEHENNYEPYLDQREALNIMQQISSSLRDFQQHNILYDCISWKNVVMGSSGKWELSTVGLIFGVDLDNSEFSVKRVTSPENKATFALGCLLFRLVFGFSPVHSSGKLDNFQINSYFNNLVTETNQKHLKVFYYSSRCLDISPLTLKLIQDALSGSLSLQEWQQTLSDASNQYQNFVSQINPANKQIKMINSVQQNGYSLIIAAIGYKKKHPYQKINKKPVLSPEQLSPVEAFDVLKKHSLYSYFTIDSEIIKNSKVSNTHSDYTQNGLIMMNYFGQKSFDPEHDYPCRDLIKWLESNSNVPQNVLKLYAYPYAIVFQLLKVQNNQSMNIRKKISTLTQILFQLSALHYPDKSIRPLHQRVPKFKKFEEVKPIFRESVNELYQYFLNEAMRKYNSKGENLSSIEKAKKKQEGLKYYRLCLKLLQMSLLFRKQGHDLNLLRIQTAQRKQIQADLTELLQKYFPKKPQVH